ncbi:MAG: CrcB family protein [Pseudonocardiaceae bacterium]
MTPLNTCRRGCRCPGTGEPLLGTGLCGGLTTFSTMQVELVKMIDARHLGLAAGYASTSVLLHLDVREPAPQRVSSNTESGGECRGEPGRRNRRRGAWVS